VRFFRAAGNVIAAKYTKGTTLNRLVELALQQPESTDINPMPMP
jgi:hypothetical protein